MLTHISTKTENTQHCYEKHWYNWYWQLRDPIFSLIIGLPFKRYTCFPMRWVKKTWSEITLKVFQTLTGVKNTWSAMENILLPEPTQFSNRLTLTRVNNTSPSFNVWWHTTLKILFHYTLSFLLCVFQRWEKKHRNILLRQIECVV